MPRFFISEEILEKTFVISGENAKHISKSLRMKVGEELVLCSPSSIDYHCVITKIEPNFVDVDVTNSVANSTEPSLKINLYQCLTKGDKFDSIIQKSVELGVNSVTPVLSSRCISRPDEKAMSKKLQRWSKIAEEAAKQSGRGIIPEIHNLAKYSEIIEHIGKHDFDSGLIVFYENATEKIQNEISKDIGSLNIFIGSEGGFSEEEISLAVKYNAKILSLGSRILRTETAPIVALSSLMFYFDEF